MTQSQNTFVDPRTKNEVCQTDSLAGYLNWYADKLAAALRAVSETALKQTYELISHTANNGGTIYVAGNGGSASISDHLCCDWTKGTRAHGHPPIRTSSLSANNALFTALANDYGYETVFSEQLEMLAKPNDVLVAISSSGNSPNIIRAIETAKKLKMQSIGMSGFSGGKLATVCDVSLHIAVQNYGIVEDCHQSLMHVLGQFLAKVRDQQSKPK